MRSSLGMRTAPVLKLTMTSARARTSLKIWANVSGLQPGPPSGVRAWIWTMAAPSAAARAASSPISFGVYGMAGHWSRLARTPVRAAVTIVLVTVWRSYRDVSVLAPRAVAPLALGLLQAAHDDSPRLRRVDHVIDHRPPRREVRIDLRTDPLQQLRSRLARIVGSLHRLVKDHVDRALRPHDRELAE